MLHGIAYTNNGSPPSASNEIVRWMCRGDKIALWDNIYDALEACEMDGWRGYVCQYVNI